MRRETSPDVSISLITRTLQKTCLSYDKDKRKRLKLENKKRGHKDGKTDNCMNKVNYKYIAFAGYYA